jgi:hypothetical protein
MRKVILREGNLIGFRIFFDDTGTLMSELRRLPQEDVVKVFKDSYDQKMIQTILSKVMENFEDLHDKIEVELDALNHGVSGQS